MNASNNFFLRNPHFSRVWAGQLLSQSGQRMFQIAAIWWLMDAAKEAPGRMVAAFMVLAALPSLLGVRWIGRRVDEVATQKLLVLCDFSAGILILLIGSGLHYGALSVSELLICGFVGALLQAHIDPALNKAVSQVSEPKDLETAVGFLTSTQSIANFGGACLGAIIIGKLGVANTCFLAGSGYLVASLFTASAQFKKQEEGTLAEQSRGGWAILNDYPLVKKALLGFACVNFFATPTLIVLPLYVKSVLEAGARELGILESGLWLGMLLGAWLSTRVQFMKTRMGLAAVTLFVFGVCLSFPAWVQSFGGYWVALFVGSLGLGLLNAKMVSFFQELIPQEVKGRFFAILQASIGFTFPIAYFSFGLLADAIGPTNVCAIQGLGVAVLAMYFSFLVGEETQEIREAMA